MALEDAGILAKSLRDHLDHETAFCGYKHLRLERVQANITTSAARSTHAPAPRAPTRPRSTPETLNAQLDWHTPLP
jgi:2-polyprenyl-6-methoxyphenol hydroxylase-like FAD-dependent oxidoreductase